MSLRKKILLAIGLVVIGIQFIQPARNKNEGVPETDITKVVSVPHDVGSLMKNACYDCHSNNTAYPWYTNVQPIGWLMSNHITKGKEALNFSEFGLYSSRRQLSKLNGISNSIKDNIMPLSSYKWMHDNARLTESEKLLLIKWVEQSKESLSAKKQ